MKRGDIAGDLIEKQEFHSPQKMSSEGINAGCASSTISQSPSTLICPASASEPPTASSSVDSRSEFTRSLFARLDKLDCSQFQSHIAKELVTIIKAVVGPPGVSLDGPYLNSGASGSTPTLTPGAQNVPSLMGSSELAGTVPPQSSHTGIPSTEVPAPAAIIEHHASVPSQTSVNVRRRDINLPSNSCFSSLPTEILDRIIGFVKDFARDEHATIVHRQSAFIEISRFGTEFEGVYLNPEPILNTFQSLAVANKTIYDLCRPRLWRNLIFPTSMPRSTGDLIDDEGFLFKHGHLVYSLSITLGKHWYCPDASGRWDPSYVENLRLYPSLQADRRFGESQGLGLHTTTVILVMCRNIRSLEVKLPFNGSFGQDGKERLHGRLIKLVRRLEYLEDLTVQCWSNEISEQHVIGLITNLPRLQSLNLSHVNQSERDQSTRPLEWHLAQLDHLSMLKMSPCSIVDGTWWQQSSPKSLTSLHLTDSNLTVIEAHQLLNRLSSQLISLKLSFEEIDFASSQPDDHDITPEWSEKNRFNLPSLTRLEFKNPTTYDILSAFQDCKKLTRLEYQDMSESEWGPAHQLFCSLNWPDLKEFIIDCPQAYELGDWDIAMAQYKMKKFAQQKGINHTLIT